MADLVGHDRSPSAFLVYLHLWAHARRATSRSVAASYRDLAEETGLSKSAAQAAVKLLLERRLLKVKRASKTATPEYAVLRPWVRPRRARPASS